MKRLFEDLSLFFSGMAFGAVVGALLLFGYIQDKSSCAGRACAFFYEKGHMVK